MFLKYIIRMIIISRYRERLLCLQLVFNDVVNFMFREEHFIVPN